MTRIRKRSICLTAVITVLIFKFAFANFSAGIATEAPKNNFQDCIKPVRKALQSIRSERWGSFEFTCKSGLVSTVFISSSTEIARHCTEFVQSNSEIFGVNAGDLHKRGLDFVQTWHAVDLRGGVQCLGVRLPVTMKLRIISANTWDTKNWNLRTDIAMSSETAKQITLDLWNKMQPGASYHIEVEKLQISPAKSPRLVWFLAGNGRQGAKRLVGECALDALTQKPATPVGCLVFKAGRPSSGH